MTDPFDEWSSEQFVAALKPLEFVDAEITGRLLAAQKFVCAGCGLPVEMGGESLTFLSFGLDASFPAVVHSECRVALASAGAWPRLRDWLDVVQDAAAIAAAAEAALRAADQGGVVVPQPPVHPVPAPFVHGDAPAPKRGPSPRPPGVG